MTTLQQKQAVFQNQYAGLNPDTITPEQIKSIILAFIDLLEELINNAKVDGFLEKIETFIEEDKIGIFRGIFAGFKISLLTKKSD